MKLAPLIDHTLLNPTATAADIDLLCQQALEHGFAAVCVLPNRVRRAAGRLGASPVKVCTVVGFPLGASVTAVKCAEAAAAIEDGADEIDMVVDLGAVKDGRWNNVAGELQSMREACWGVVLKVIFETGLLTDDEKRRLSALCGQASVDFVKTSTGSTHGGATVEDVALMRAHAGPGVGVKASGGIRTAEDARALVAAGATRLGTSHGVTIVAERKPTPGVRY